MNSTALERFWRKVRKTDGCWYWTAATNQSGYGWFLLKSRRSEQGTRTVLAHRFSWEIQREKIPDGMEVLHRCDNRRCVNPDHLFLGTQPDNVEDMKAKGRMAVGAKRHNAKLNDEKVRQILDLRASGMKHKDIARMFGVYFTVIVKISTGVRWKHIPR